MGYVCPKISTVDASLRGWLDLVLVSRKVSRLRTSSSRMLEDARQNIAFIQIFIPFQTGNIFLSREGLTY
jgi:hypothetical protein